MAEKKRVTIRLDDKLIEKINKRANELNITTSDYIRQAIELSFGKGDCIKQKGELPLLILTLNRLGNNLNQIARTLNYAKKADKLNEVNYDKLLNELIAIRQFLKDLLNDY